MIAPDPAVPQGENMGVPEGWKWRLDHPHPDAGLTTDPELSDGRIFFVNMTPGWHITTGPAAILYHPGLSAENNYRAEVTYHLFQPGDRNEAFGLFVGGADLDGENQQYVYFLIRKTGEFLIKRRDGDSTAVLHDWKADPAIRPYTVETDGSVENALAVNVRQDSILFYVNDEEVASVATGELPSRGLVGLRINHALNVHVSDLRVTEAE